jgi:hypothetical protein
MNGCPVAPRYLLANRSLWVTAVGQRDESRYVLTTFVIRFDISTAFSSAPTYSVQFCVGAVANSPRITLQGFVMPEMFVSAGLDRSIKTLPPIEARALTKQRLR